MKNTVAERIQHMKETIGLTEASQANLEKYLEKRMELTLNDGTKVTGTVYDVRTEGREATTVWIESDFEIYKSDTFRLMELEKGIRKNFVSTVTKESCPEFGVTEERVRSFMIDVQTDNDMDTVAYYFKSRGFEISVWGDGFDKYIGYIDVYMDDNYDSVVDFKADINARYKQMKKEMK